MEGGRSVTPRKRSANFPHSAENRGNCYLYPFFNISGSEHDRLGLVNAGNNNAEFVIIEMRTSYTAHIVFDLIQSLNITQN